MYLLYRLPGGTVGLALVPEGEKPCGSSRWARGALKEKERSSTTTTFFQRSGRWPSGVGALLVLACLSAILGTLTGSPAAHAAQTRATATCLSVQPRITPSRDTLPFNEVLQITVTNGCGQTLSGTTLAVTDRIRCGSQPWVVDLSTSAGPQTLAPGGSMSWWITGLQTGCPSGEVGGPFQQWLHGDASGTGEGTGRLFTGAGDASLNV